MQQQHNKSTLSRRGIKRADPVNWDRPRANFISVGQEGSAAYTGQNTILGLIAVRKLVGCQRVKPLFCASLVLRVRLPWL